MDLSFAQDSRIWCLAIESLRSEHADLSDANVIKARYKQIENNEIAISTMQESSGALVSEVEKEEVAPVEVVEEKLGGATPRRKKANKE